MFFRVKYKYLLYFLLILYVSFLAYSVFEIGSLMTYERETVNVVKDRARDIRSRINEQQNVVPGLLSTGLPYSGIEAELQRQETRRERVLTILKETYPGDSKTIDALLDAFRQYRTQVRKLATRLEDNKSFVRAGQSFEVELMPYIRQILTHINIIDQAIDEISIQSEEEIRLKMNLLVLFSLVLGAVILIVMVAWDRQEKANNREIAYREKLFNQLSQNVDEVFIVAAGPEDFTYASPNSLKLLGLEASAIQEKPDTLYSLIQKKSVADWLRKSLSQGQTAKEEAEEEITIPILEKSFRVRVYPIGNISGRNERFLISFSEQTQSVRQRQALNMALENANAASAAKTGFLSHMSHEIRTPMNAIIGMTTIALAKINDLARVKDCLGKIAESSRHLLGLINDVLDMSKIESGKLSINQEPFNLRKSIGQIRDLVQPQAQAKDLDFDIDVDIENSELVGDSLRLNQILLNLLSNAYKFTPAGGKISLKVKQLPKRKNLIPMRFVVSDTGIGMSEEFLARLYTPFEQASSGTAARYGGTGLGMPITHNLVSLMGGIISVNSAEGEGTTFTIEVPFAPALEPLDKTAGLPEMKVLVVDDDPGTCEHAALLLSKMGLKTEWVLNGHEAIEKVRKAQEAGEQFDVCLIDWKMPDMDGAETARHIRKIVGDEMLIIIISAFDLSAIKEDARKAGVNDFITKPFFSSTLYDVLLSSSRSIKKDELKKSKSKKYDFAGRRVLLVEDNEFNREIGQEFLEMAHVDVENAENGHIALEKMLASPPGYYDLVLMDIQMPVMDGYDATKSFRASDHQQAETLPILAMTANAFNDDVSRAMAAGMNGHIAKPIDVNELYAKLANYL